MIDLLFEKHSWTGCIVWYCFPPRNWRNSGKSIILPKSVNLMVGKQRKSRSHCSLIHKLLFSPTIPKLSYTRILNSASIEARALGFVVEGKRRSVEPSVVACSCGLAPLCFDGLHLLPSEQPAIQGKKWERKEEAWRKFPHTHSVWHSRRAKTNGSTDR